MRELTPVASFPDPEIYRDILENLPTGLCVIDVHKKILLWSDGAERITGRRRHEVTGHSCVGLALLHCDHPDCEFCHEDCPLAQAMKTSHISEAIGFVHHKEGYELPVRARAIPVRDAHGSVIGAAEIFENQQLPANPHEREQMKQHGFVDEVTSVPTRVVAQAHLRESMGTFVDVKVPFGVLFIRLEGLPEFRARFGADAASSLLRFVARTLESAVWATDFIGRWSESEFLIIVKGSREEALGAVRKRARHMLANDGIAWWGERLSLPVSIGGTITQDGDSLESFLCRAQKSLETAPGRDDAAIDRSGESAEG